MKYKYGNVEYEGDDFYCYPDSSVLMNKFGIRDSEKLQEIEQDISYAKIAYLDANPLKGDFNCALSMQGYFLIRNKRLLKQSCNVFFCLIN